MRRAAADAPAGPEDGPDPSTRGFAAIRQLFAQRDFRRFTVGNSVSLVGTWVQRVAIGWLTWELTESGTWLGIVAAADLLPAAVVGPIGGVLADRLPRLTVIFVAQSLLLVQAAALFLLTATGLATIWSVFALALFGGIVVGFNQPARMALTPSLVPRRDLAAAVAINSAVFNVARFIGPAIAGALIVGVGLAAAFALNALSFFAFLAALRGLTPDAEATMARSGGGQSIAAAIGDALRYVAGHPGIGVLFALMLAGSVLVRPVTELLPGFAAAVFGGGAELLAALNAAFGVGATIGALALAMRAGDRSGLPRLCLLATGVSAAALLGFAVADSLLAALPAIALCGCALVVSGVSGLTLIQLSVEGALRGRVLSLYGMLFRAGPAAGAVAMGAISDFVGLRWPLAIAGAVMLATLIPALGRLPRLTTAFESPR